MKMKNNPDDDPLYSLLAAVNDIMKIDAKSTEDTFKIRRILGNTRIVPRDSFKCSVMLDFSNVSAAFHYYKYKKCMQNMDSNTSALSNDIFHNNCALIKDTDCISPMNSSNLEKTLSSLQMDTDLISEWPKLNTDFLNLYSFFDEQIESIDIPSNPMAFQKDKLNENDFSNTAIVNCERNNSDLKAHLKSLDGSSCECGTLLQMPNENFQTKSVISEHSISSRQESTNIGKKNLILQYLHDEAYFPEELDYEPSDIGEEAKKINNEFCIHDVLKDEEKEKISNYCPKVEASENSTLHKKINEEVRPNDYTEMCVDQDLISFFQNNFEYDDEDESESDKEHSFKRNSSRNRQDQEALQQSLIDSDISEIGHLKSFNEVILYICEQCKSGNINEAIAIANKSIAVSMKDAQLEIFKELFINTINFIKSYVPFDNVMISKSLDEIMKIFHQAKLFDSHLCSLIINECFGCDHTIKIGMKLFSFIQKIKVPVYSNAILSYIDIIILKEFPSLELILLMEYVKFVCNLPCPKTLLCKVLKDFSKAEKSSLLIGFFRLCKFLCSINSLEVEMNYLQNFIEICIKNDCWTQIACFFQAWYKDGCLISCLVRSFLFQPEDVGMFYEKLAEEIYKYEDVSLYLVGIFGQMGVFLMLEVFSKNQYESAFQVLFMLHKRNINYLELQACLYNASSYLKNMPKFPDTFVFPFTVAFAAMDICFHLKRFKDGYCIFKSFSLNLSENMEDKIKLKVRSQRFRYLLKLTKELYSIEPLKLGLQAFHDICFAAKDFSLEEVEEFAEEIQIIYNRYLTRVINESQLHTALELFEYSEGQMREIFIINFQVLRSLLVTFAQNDKMEEAYKFFSLGCIRKIYNVEQNKMEENVWRLIILSSWEIYEVEFIIKTFIKNISQSWSNENKTGFDMQLSVQILFEESKEDCLEIDCLKKFHTIASAKEIACNVLKSLDANIKWVENENLTCLELVPETIYNYWINTSLNFLLIKNSGEKSLENTRSKSELKIQLSEEDFGYKHSTESNSEKSSNKVLGRLTPEYSVADSSYQLILDKASDLLKPIQTLLKTHHEPLETTYLEITDHQISNNDLRSAEQEQIISSSNQLPLDAPSSTTTEKVSKIDASEKSCNNSKINLQNQKTFQKIGSKRKFFKGFGQFSSKNSVLKTLKWRRKIKRVCLKKSKKKCTSVSETSEILPPLPSHEHSLPETKNLFQRCISEPWRVQNFQVTLKNSIQGDGSRSVMHTSLAKLGKVENVENNSNVPETVFQKIVLFLQSKVLLKCKDLQPQEQKEKANHLATLFIQNNIVTKMDKKTMKLLSEFAKGCI